MIIIIFTARYFPCTPSGTMVSSLTKTARPKVVDHIAMTLEVISMAAIIEVRKDTFQSSKLDINPAHTHTWGGGGGQKELAASRSSSAHELTFILIKSSFVGNQPVSSIFINGSSTRNSDSCSRSRHLFPILLPLLQLPRCCCNYYRHADDEDDCCYYQK